MARTSEKLQAINERMRSITEAIEMSNEKLPLEELRQSEARFRALVDQAAAGVAETDLHGTFTFVNQTYCEITGYEREELLGMRWHDITHSNDLPRNSDLFARMLAEHTSFQIEKRYVRKDGSFIWVNNSVALIRDAAGNPESVLAVSRDIGDRKRAEMNTAFLADVEKDFARLQDVDDMLETVGAKINRYFGFSMLTFADINDAADEATIIFNSRDPNVQVSVGRYRLADFLSERHRERLQAGHIITIEDVATDNIVANGAAYQSFGVRSMIGVPYGRDGRWKFLLTGNRRETSRWRADEIELLGQLASRIWLWLERTRAEAVIRASEERYRTLFNSIDEGFAVNEILFDEAGNAVDYRILETNSAHKKITGLSDAVGKTALELVPNFEAYWIETLGNVAKTGEPVRVENRVEALDRWFDVYAFRVGQPQSHKVGVVYNDITERKQAEHALRESEARFRNMADNAPVMMWITDTDAHCTYLSTSWYAFTGQTPATGLGLGWLDATHPNDREHSEQIFLDANAHHAPFRLEYRLRRSDGAYRWALDSAVPRFAHTGEFLGYIGSVIDIEERKQAEERLGALLAKGADMITVSDRDGTILYASPSTERVSGYTTAEFQGSNPFAASIHPDDVARCRDAMEQLFATPGLSLTLEHRARHKSGAWHWFEGTFTSLFHDPAVGGLVANVRDITERKQAEEDIAQLYAAETAARVEAEAALQTRDQFLSIASHELRTPLTSLMGYASLLRTAAARGTGDIGKMTDRINRQAQRLNGLIEQLLDVSRLQQGQFTVERRAVDLAALVREVVSEVRATLPPYAAHTIDVIGLNEPLVVVGDVHRLEEVLQNLLHNAIKYSPQGGPIHVRLGQVGTEAVVEVVDQGIGVPAEAQAHVFEPFYRAPNVGAQASGFGLGLHIVREIVQRHGGRIALQSTQGHGSTFRVVLPLRPDKNTQQDATSALD